MEFDQFFEKYNELLFIFPTEDLTLKAILFFHSINLCKSLECTGILEDDPQGEIFILPENWDKPIENIYSLRYQTKTKSPVYYKFIKINQTIEINAVNSTNPGIILHYEQSLLNFEPNKEMAKKYCSEILDKIFLDPKKKEPENNRNLIDRDTLFWGNPRNNNSDNTNTTNVNTNPFGNYGRSDLQPVPLGNNNIFGDRNTGGNMMGPNNPIFNNPFNLQGGGGGNPFNPNNPGVRFDPFGPDPDINNFGFPNANNPFPKPGTGFGPFGFNKPF